VIDPATTGLVAYYRFEEGAGADVFDTSAAGAPAGELIAGAPGNGEWVSFVSDPLNTAPVCISGQPGCGPVAIPATSAWGILCLGLALICAESLVMQNRLTRKT